MSKFFTYEHRLTVQKYLKESLSFKEIASRLDKNSITISREVHNYSSEVATGYRGFQTTAVSFPIPRPSSMDPSSTIICPLRFFIVMPVALTRKELLKSIIA